MVLQHLAQYKFSVFITFKGPASCTWGLVFSVTDNGATSLGLDMYNGEYESELDYDENGWPWWESDSYAIWWSDNAWRVGPKENREANPNDAAFVSTSNRLCPHHFWLSDGQYVDDLWSYVGADGELEDAGLHATKAAGGTVIANPCK